MADDDLSRFVPWPWSITPTDPNKCPSSSAILGTFAAVNVIVSLVSLLSGNRLIVQRCSFGLLGNKDYDQSWKIFWIVPLATQLAANAINAALVKRVEGYETTFTVGQLVLLYTARPRLSWICLLYMSLRAVKSPRSELPGGLKGLFYPNPRRPSNWRNAALSNFVAEIMLQLISFYVVGRTINFGSKHVFHGRHGYSQIPADLSLFYAGAVCYVAGVGTSLILLSIPWWSPSSWSRKSMLSIEGDDKYNHDDHKLKVAVFIFGGSLFEWISSWLFWAGYVKVAGDRYCPPKLLEQGVVWVVFSIIGIFFGTGS